jgi:hypothetical protein
LIGLGQPLQRELRHGRANSAEPIAGVGEQALSPGFAAMRLRHDADNIPVTVKNAPPKRGIVVEMGWDAYPRPLDLSSVEEAVQPLVTTGPGVGYLPIGALPTGYLPIGALPTGAGAGGGGCLRGRSAAAAALSIAKDAAAAVSIFSMM